jgi:hypothetical protein
MTEAARRRRTVAVGLGRVGVGAGVMAVLAYGYTGRLAVGDGNPLDYFGYFTNQTSLLASVVLTVVGVLSVADRRVPPAFTLLRGIVTTYLLVVAVVYNILVPGTGSAPPWVSILLHVAFPLLVALDWLFIGDRSRLPWPKLWILLPYPVLWLTVVLIRGATDGWVPYGFLLPERGSASLIGHIVGIFAVIIAAGSLVWAGSAVRGGLLGPDRPKETHRVVQAGAGAGTGLG